MQSESKLTKDQKKTMIRKFSADGRNYEMRVTIRFDDECGNGHNTFSITSDTYLCDVKGNPVRWDSGGCQHEDMARVFPELAHLIKWHLCSTDGPIHYPANAVYLASDKDHRGLRAGEKRQLRNGRTGIPVWEIVDSRTGQRPQIGGMIDSADKPTDPVPILEWAPVWIIGEGKKRELDSARSAAIWPDATDEDLISDDLADKLRDRLPGLIAEFRRVVESLGFTL